MKFEKFKKIFSLVPKHLRNNLVLIFFANFIGTFLEVASISMLPIIVLNILNPTYLIKIVETHNFNLFHNIVNHENSAIYLLTIVCIFYILKNIYLLAVIYFQRKLGIKIINFNRKLIFYNYLFADYQKIIKNNPSRIITLITAEITSSSSLVEICLLIIRELILLTFIVLALLFINPYVTFLTFGVLLTFILLFYFSISKLAEMGGKINLANRLKNIKIVNETFDLIKEIKIYNKLDYFFQLFSEQIKLSEKYKLFNAVFSAIPRFAVEICLILIILLIIVVNKFFFSNNLDLLPIITFIGASSIRIVPAFKLLASSINQLSFNTSALNMVTEEINKLDNKKLIYKSSQQVKRMPFKKEVKFENISFYYSDNRDLTILSNINLVIKKGEKVGIIGSSGSGKSTLLNILLGLIKPSNGTVLIDGVNLSKNTQAWQKNIGYVPQDVNLMQNSLKNNIAFAIEKSDLDSEKINNALKKAELYSFVDSNQNKINFDIESKGLNISGGQRQRVGITRAIYQDPQILILDEATNSLDEKTEKKIINNIFKDVNLTVVVVAHRISCLSSCDKIIYLGNGDIKDVDTYENIVKKYKLI